MVAQSAETTTAAPSKKHIVEVLIEERAPGLVASPVWPLYRAILYPLLRAPQAVRMADAIQGKSGTEVMAYMSDLLALKVDVEGADNLPRGGRVIVAPIHPTGIADGIAMWDALKSQRPDQIYFANRDAIRVTERLAEVLIPVEWVAAKRTRQRSRETLLAANAAFEADRCVVLFPSGRLAFMNEKRELTEQEWQPSIAIFARKYRCAVVPTHIEARNSWLYYWFRGLSPELRDITLFNELLNKKGKTFRVTFGKPIPHEALQGDPTEVAARLRHHAWRGIPSGTPWGEGS